MRNLGICLVLTALVLLAACGREASVVSTQSIEPGSVLIAPILGGLELTREKSVSGLPTGVIVTWERVDDPLAVGYYLYRDTQHIDTANPALRTNGGDMIGQPGSGTAVTFYDEFYPLVGQTYYYRLSVVDVYDEESDLSNELSIEISTQEVTGLNPLSGYYGDTVVISGTDFGIHNVDDDYVFFPTDSSERIEATILSWEDTEIQCVVPLGAITGRVQVEIASTVAESDEDFTILNPFLISVSPKYASYNEEIRILGDNLTDTPGPADGVTFPGDVFIPYGTGFFVSWSDTEIIMRVPPAIGADGEITARVAEEDTNGVGFSVRPAIETVTPRKLVPGSATKVSVTGLNLGNILVSTLYIIDESEEEPVPSVEVDDSFIVSWDNNEIVFRVPFDEYGELPALRVKRGSYWSDSYMVVMLEPLQISFLFPAQHSTLEEPTTIAVTSVIDLSRVEFYLGSATWPLYIDAEGPDFSFMIDPQDYNNGSYYIIAKAYRGGERAYALLLFDILTLPGDTNGDGVVDDADVDKLKQHLGLTSEDALYHRYLDPNDDGQIDERDVSFIGYHFTGSFEEP